MAGVAFKFSRRQLPALLPQAQRQPRDLTPRIHWLDSTYTWIILCVA
jgi:hypothetical protein